MVSSRLEPLIRRHEYTDEVAAGARREESHFDVESNDDYLFKDNVLGPVLLPYYKNHGLTKSQRFIKFFTDQVKVISKKGSDQAPESSKKKNPWDNDFLTQSQR